MSSSEPATPSRCSSDCGSNGKLISDCGTELGGIHSLSFDHRSCTTTRCPPTAARCSSPRTNAAARRRRHEVFARIDNGQAGAHTVAISEPTSEDCSSVRHRASLQVPATFEGASVGRLEGLLRDRDSRCWAATPRSTSTSTTSMRPREKGLCGSPAGTATVSSPVAEVEGRGGYLRGRLARVLRRAWCADDDAQRSGADRARRARTTCTCSSATRSIRRGVQRSSPISSASDEISVAFGRRGRM